MTATGEWQTRRADQQVAWMWDMLQQRMMDALKHGHRTGQRLKDLETSVRRGETAVSVAVEELASLIGV